MLKIGLKEKRTISIMYKHLEIQMGIARVGEIIIDVPKTPKKDLYCSQKMYRYFSLSNALTKRKGNLSHF